MKRELPSHAKKVFQGNIFAVWQWDQECYDGSTHVFEVLSRPDYGTAIGVLPNKNILLAWDEQPDRDPLLTTVGGRIEDGESPEEGTAREFIEETGYKPGAMRKFFAYTPSGKIAFQAHMFIARDLKKIGEPALDAGEKIELREFTFDEFLSLGSSDSTELDGPIRDMMLRIKLLEAQVDKTKRDALYSLLYE